MSSLYGGSICLIANNQGCINATGTQAELLSVSGTVIDTYTIVILGDVNGDSVVDAFDTAKMDLHLYSPLLTVAYSSGGFRYYDFVNAESEEAFVAYIIKCKELALYDTGASAEYGDKLITLSTCEYSAQNGGLLSWQKGLTNNRNLSGKGGFLWLILRPEMRSRVR